MKRKSFETLWKGAKEYTAFRGNNYVAIYNCFMLELEDDARDVQGSDFEPKRFAFFMQSWRWNAQQEQMNHNRTPKQLCRDVYEAYGM